MAMLSRYRMPLMELAGGLGGGLLAGVLGAVLGRTLGGTVLPSMGDVVNGFGDLIGALMGFGLGYPTGVGVGIALLRRSQKRAAGFGPALAGAGLGAVLVLALAAVSSLSAIPWALQLLFVSVPLVTALVAVRLWVTWTTAGQMRQG